MKVRGNIVTCYSQLGEHDLALDMQQDMYSEAKRIFGETSEEALSRAQNLVLDLMNKGATPTLGRSDEKHIARPGAFTDPTTA